jgi:murein DD-endopeptidase MepM/ murein hydrolase activator NlpD
MADFAQALAVGALVSLAAGAVIWLVFSHSMSSGTGVGTWRLARLTCFIPLIAAPLIYLVPEPAAPLAVMDPMMDHTALSGAFLASETGNAGPIPPPALSFVTLMKIYLAGLLVSLALAWLRHFQRARLLKSSRSPDEHECRMLEASVPDGELPHIRILVSDSLPAPVLTGWASVIIFPQSLFDDAAALRIAATHEYVHARRGDERDRLIGSALVTLLWFHLPLKWIEQELTTARELACDAETLDVLGSTARTAYAATLIDAMRLAAPAASAFGPQDRRHRKMRIKAILAGHRPARFRSTILAASALTVVIPLTVAQAVWIDRRDAPVLVQQIEPVMGITAPAQSAADIDRVNLAQNMAPAADVAFTARPVEGGRISSNFGPRPARPAAAPPFHNGTDIAAPEGTAILAPAAGRVVHAEYGFGGSEAWGNTLALDHGNGWQTVYAHMQGFDVAVGDTVTSGQQIGRVGNTGNSTGPHVHVEVRLNGERIDPADHVPGLR